MDLFLKMFVINVVLIRESLFETPCTCRLVDKVTVNDYYLYDEGSTGLRQKKLNIFYMISNSINCYTLRLCKFAKNREW